MEHLLSYIIFTPLLFALILLAVPKKAIKVIVGLSFFASIATLALALKLYINYQPVVGFSFVETLPWIRAWNVEYKVGVDGVSMLLVLLTAFTLPLVVLFSYGSIHKQEKEYYFCLLLLQTAMLGTFCALDLFVFYVFWEVMLIPMYFLIGIWGGERRIYAALKLFLYTLLGSVLMLAGIIYLYLQAGQSFDYNVWMEKIRLAPQIQLYVFAAFALAFAIKVPMFPLHTWLPDAHVEAPTAGSVILAGILLKMGTYGFYRFAMPLFPEALHQAQPFLITLAVIGIVYGALVSMVQPDIKKLIAYSSVSHLGFVMLGLFSLTTQGVQGAIYQMLNHGISTGALFLLVGMLYDRRHTRLISEYGGIAKVMPLYSIFFLIVTFSSIGLPGTNGFVGEFLVLLGSFQTQPIAAIIASSGVILAAVYMLWMVQRVFFGPLNNPKNEKLKDLGFREAAIILPLIVLIFWMGIYPKPLFQKMEVSVNQFLSQVKR